MEQTTEQKKLPNATLILILGIASIITCCCYGIGLILGIVALFLAQKDIALYAANPELYTDYKNLNTGKILAIIGIVLNAIYLIYIIWMFATFGLETMQDPELMQEKMRELLGQ